MAVRRLTVGCTYQERARAKLTPVPFIRLTGKWLESAGFHPGQKIALRISSAEIVITRSHAP